MKKSILGGNTIKKEDPGNGVPGPATYFTSDVDGDLKWFDHIPGYKIMKPINVKEEEKGKLKETPVGPWKYSPKFPTHVSSAWKVGTG